MKMVITYKSGHKRVMSGCSFIEANTYDKPRGCTTRNRIRTDISGAMTML